jgi:lipoprotein-anchoring transpeptidase ErfK/SrfK
VTATPSLHVSKTHHRLAYLLDGVMVREFPVGLGKDDKTPEGTFLIATRLPEPVWFNAGESIPYGDPRNILGTRWLGFENRPGMVGFGIHGTNDESTIGLDLSNGCVRMRNKDVEELFDLVPAGVRITIER